MRVENTENPRIGVLLVCKNEVEALTETAPQMRRILDSDSRLYELYLDGNSEDGSLEILRSLGLRVQLEGPGGLRGALNQAANHLVDAGCEYILFAQPDGNCDLEAIPQLVETCLVDSCDLVVASRYLDDAVSHDDNPVSKLGNKVFTFTANLLTGRRFTDVMVGFRIVSVKSLVNSNIMAASNYSRVERIFSTSVSWDPLMSVRGGLLGWNIGEIPVSEPARLGGEMKRSSLRWGGAYMAQILYEGVKTHLDRFRNRRRRPVDHAHLDGSRVHD